MNHINLWLSKRAPLSPNPCKKDDSYLQYSNASEAVNLDSMWRQERMQTEAESIDVREQRNKHTFCTFQMYSTAALSKRFGADLCMCWHLKWESEEERLFLAFDMIETQRKDSNITPDDIWQEMWFLQPLKSTKLLLSFYIVYTHTSSVKCVSDLHPSCCK